MAAARASGARGRAGVVGHAARRRRSLAGLRKRERILCDVQARAGAAAEYLLFQRSQVERSNPADVGERLLQLFLSSSRRQCRLRTHDPPLAELRATLDLEAFGYARKL